jgi:hypothetical protein
VIDDTRGGWSDALEAEREEAAGGGEDRAFAVSDERCLAMNAMHDRGYGHTASASWSFWHPETSMVMMHDWLSNHKSLPENAVDRVWFLEYDVRCSGSFAQALAACDAEVPDADFVACGGGEGQTSLRTFREDPSWCWWPHLSGEIESRVPLSERVGAFFPAVRVSKKLVEALRGEFGKSTGFCEVYVPTLCATTPGLVAAAIPKAALGQYRTNRTSHRPCG